MHTQLFVTNYNNCIAESKSGRRPFSSHVLLIEAFILCMWGYGIYHIYGFSIYPDEFGYWSVAAGKLGYDWSQVVSLGYYYSYGYSVILTPILWIFKDSVTAYRAAVTINVLLLAVSVFPCMGILKKIAPDLDENKRFFAIGMAVSYPVWIMHTQMTMVEALLTFLFVLWCYESIRFMEAPGIPRGILILLLLAYMYTVHMRTIGIIVGALPVYGIYLYKNKKGKYLIAAALAVICAAAVICLVKMRVTSNTYSGLSTDALSVNDYAGHLGALKQIFTLEGIKDLFISLCGKLYYLLAASFGTFFFAILWMCREIRTNRRERIKKAVDTDNAVQTDSSKLSNGYASWFYVLLMVSALGQIVVVALTSMNPGRLDGYVYGRYTEYFLPVFILIGIRALFGFQKVIRVYGIDLAVTSVTGVIAAIAMKQSGLTNMEEYFSAGISYMKNIVSFSDNAAAAIAISALLSAVCGSVIIAAAIAVKKWKHVEWLLFLPIIMQLGLALLLCERYPIHFSDYCYQDLRICEQMTDEQLPIYFINEDERNPSIDWIQFVLRDRTVNVIHAESAKGADESMMPEDSEYYLLLNGDSEYTDLLEESKQLNITGRYRLYKIKQD